MTYENKGKHAHAYNYSTYFAFCVNYTNSINCISFLFVLCVQLSLSSITGLCSYTYQNLPMGCVKYFIDNSTVYKRGKLLRDS